MKNILVTGSDGQLGREVKGIAYIHKYRAFNFIFTDIDALDITDNASLQNIFGNYRIDYIINCAAFTLVDKAEAEAEMAYLINAKGVSNILKFAEKQSAVIIQISTDYVFDGCHYTPYTEDAKTNPLSEYGKSKLEAEKILAGYNKSIIVRTSWLYSEKGNNFLNTILKLSEENRELRVVFDQTGSPTYAKDLARVLLDIVLFCENSEIVPSGIYHYSNEGVCSWYDFARAIIVHSGKNTKVVPVETREFPRPAPRPHYSVLNKSKIKSVFGIFIPHWDESLIACLTQLDK